MFRRRGNTQKKIYHIYNTAKVRKLDVISLVENVLNQKCEGGNINLFWIMKSRRISSLILLPTLFVHILSIIDEK
jgi:hypothetical protein